MSASAMEILAVDTAVMKWLALGPGVWFKPVRFRTDGSGWVSLVRVEPGASVPRHQHRGPVQGFHLQGSGRFVESNLVTRAGTFSYEPSGVVDTLVAEGREDLVVLFIVEGAIAFLDEAGEVRRVEDASSKLASCLTQCAAHRMSPPSLTY